MKFVNFKTYEDRHGLEPGQLVCAADLELKACEGKEECYLVMINPKFDFGVDYRGGEVRWKYGCCCFSGFVVY